MISSQSIDRVARIMGLLLTLSRRWKGGALWVAYAVLFATPLVGQPSPTLTPKDVNEAIEWGLTSNPSPYLLHHEDGRPGTGVNSVIVGAIYTPFLRVALAAKAARDKREDFTPADVKAAWIEPVVYVAFRWYCCVDRDHGNDLAAWDPSKPPVDYEIAVPGDRVLGGRVTASPLWVRHDISLLASFGGDPPYRDVVLIAAYPMSALSTSPDFVIYREWPSATSPTGKDRGMIVGRVTPGDLTRWR
jgi:hypothetical protein